MGILSWIVLGLVAGALAKWLMPGPDGGGWHSMTVRMVGDHITCDLDGMRMLDVHDTTFAAAGRVGLWTKADAVTMFDDLTIAPLR